MPKKALPSEKLAPADNTGMEPKTAVESGRIRLRAFILGLLLIPPGAWWVIFCEDVNRGPYPTTISLFANAIFILAAIITLNTLARMIFRRPILSQAEMLIVYVMVCIGASLAGLDMIPVLMQIMAHPTRFATPDNQWLSLFGKYLPDWLTIKDASVLRGYYEGHSSLYSPEIMKVWITPALAWTGFIMVLLFVMMCVNTLVRKQWVDRERLTFPIVQLPMAMTEPVGKLWKNKLMWTGFIIAAGIDVLNGLAFYYPSIPSIPVKHVDFGNQITTHPWNAIGWTPYSFYPFVIGLGFLLPADLSFSCWFFYIFWKMQLVVSRAAAWDINPDFPYINRQCFGGYMAVLVVLLWSARGYLHQLLRLIVGKQSELDDSKEAMSYRMAAVGTLIGVLLLTVFAWRAGLSPIVGLAFFAIYFAISTAIARMRAELGPPVHDLHFTGPDVMMTQAMGTQAFTPQELTILNMFWWFNRAYRGHPMPIGIEGMKMAQEARASQRKFLYAFMIAGLAGCLAAFWMYLHLAYTRGAAASFYQGMGFGNEAYSRLNGWMLNRKSPDGAGNLATLTGFAFSLLLGFMRIRFYGWPFHPIGYAISGSWSMNLVWLPIMIAWLLKVTVLRFGGMRLYRNAIPFFLGLILGEMIAGPAWTLIAIVLGIPAYSFWGA